METMKQDIMVGNHRRSPLSPGTCDHWVQFYNEEEYLYNVLSDFFAPLLVDGESSLGALVLARRRTIKYLEGCLATRNFTCGGPVNREEQSRKEGESGFGTSLGTIYTRGHRTVLLVDADEVLAILAPNNELNEQEFHKTVNRLLLSLHLNESTELLQPQDECRPPIYAYGELVDVLCARSQHLLALELEALWNLLFTSCNISLLCGYKMDSFQGSLGENAFAEVCHSHASVVPTESYSNLATGNQKLAMVALLQQKAMAFNNVQQLHWSNRDAEQQIKYREQFVDVLCHELRNPLSGIIGNVELLQMGLGVRQGIISTDQNGRGNSDTRLSAGNLTLLQKQLTDDFASVDAIATCAEHMKTVSDDVLNLSKLEEGKVLLVNETFDLKATIASVVKMFLTAARKKGVQLLAKVPTEELCVLGDRGRVSQVVINLISNALKFTGNGSIIVELSCLGPALLGGRASVFKVAVRDTGCGLSQDEISALFQRFVQPVSMSVAEHCGSGLGLYISKHLANLMGGLLCVESKKGYGSTFVFTFQAELCMVAGWTDTSQQLSDEASHLDYTYNSTGRTSVPGTIDQEREIENPERSLPKSSPASSISATNASVITSTELCDSGTSRVLLVDDNPIIVRVLTRILESATGLTICVSTASNGYEAIGKLIALSNSPFPIDLVLMDLEMPFLNGLKTAREIRRLNNPDGGDFSSVTQRRQAERLAATPIVGLTGDVRESRFIEARDSGMDDCLGKPIVKKTLLDLIQKYVSSPKSTGHTKSLRHEVRKIHLQLEDLTVD